MASLRRRLTAPVLALAIAAAAPALASAADPQATARPLTCAERFPENGPGGVDLRLGCIVSELVGLYSAGDAGPPPTLSTYAIGVISAVLLLIGAGLLVTRTLAGRAAQRLAPTLPSEWWLCPSCRSVNAAQATRCYSCGSPPAGGPTMPTDDTPTTPQSFGRGKRE